MKSIIITLLITILTSVSARQVIMPETIASGIEIYSGNYITRYLVNASTRLGNHPTIMTVFKKGMTKAISGNEVIFTENSFKQNWGGFKRPNYMLYVVHKTREHALNGNGLNSDPFNNVVTPFKSPDFINNKDKTVRTEANQRFLIRKFISKKELEIRF